MYFADDTEGHQLTERISLGIGERVCSGIGERASAGIGERISPEFAELSNLCHQPKSEKGIKSGKKQYPET